MKVKNRIKELRLKNNLSQQALAEKVGLSNQSISFYELGKREPKIEAWQRLANFFGVSVSYIMGISDISDPKRFTDFASFMDSINVSKTKDYLKLPRNEILAFGNEDTINKFNILFNAVKHGIGALNEKELNKKVNQLDQVSQLDDISFASSTMFELALDANTGNKKAVKAYKEIMKIMEKYLGLDEWDENEPVRIVKQSDTNNNQKK